MTRFQNSSTLVVALTILLAPVTFGYAEETQPLPIDVVQHNGPVDFEQEILPILRRNCLSCHNATTAKSDLNLESPKSMLKGGTIGEGLLPGNAVQSIIFQTASHQSDPIMPPADNKVGAIDLTPVELGLLRLWINEGAKGELTNAPKPIAFQPLPKGIVSIYSVGVSPDGRFAAASSGNQVFVYRLSSRQEVACLSDPSLSPASVADLDVVQSIAFSPDGERIATSGFRAAKVWLHQQAAIKTELPPTNAETRCLAVSNSGKFAAIGEANGVVEIYDLVAAKKLHSVRAHDSEIVCVAFNSNDSQWVTGSSSNEIRIWNVNDGVQAGQILLSTPPTAVAFIAQDSQIVTGHADNRIRVWPASDFSSEQAKSTKELGGHNGPITALSATDLSGSQFLSSSADGFAFHWDTASGNVLQRYNHGAPISSVSIRRDGKRVATGSQSGTAKLWNAENGQAIADLAIDIQSQRAVERQQLAIELTRLQVSNGKSNLENAAKLQTDEEANAKKSVESVAKAEAEVKLKTEAVSQPVTALDEADKALALLKTELAAAQAAKVAADSVQVQAAESLAKVQAGDEKLRSDAEVAKQAADEAKQKAEANLNEMAAKVKASEPLQATAAVAAKKAIEEKATADANLLAALQTVERVKESVNKANEAKPRFAVQLEALQAAQKQAEDELVSLQKSIHSVPAEQRPAVRSVAFSKDGRRLVVACSDGRLPLFSGEGGDAMELNVSEPSDLIASTFIDNTRLFVLNRNQSLAICDSAAESWKLERIVGTSDSPNPLQHGVTAVSFSRDGKYLATGSGDPSRSGELRFWNVADGALIQMIPDAHSDTIFCIEFSPDGNYLATGGADRFVKIFEVASGKLIKSLEGHTHHVLGVSWRMDGRWLVSSGADKVIKVWDVLTGEQARTIAGFGKEVSAIQYLGASDNFVLATGDHQVTTRNTGGGSGPNFEGATGFLYSLRATQNSKSIVAGGDDGMLRVWDQQGTSLFNIDMRTQ